MVDDKTKNAIKSHFDAGMDFGDIPLDERG